jgi:hypothetical protein
MDEVAERHEQRLLEEDIEKRRNTEGYKHTVEPKKENATTIHFSKKVLDEFRDKNNASDTK